MNIKYMRYDYNNHILILMFMYIYYINDNKNIKSNWNISKI